jgi:hypothetical protein
MQGNVKIEGMIPGCPTKAMRAIQKTENMRPNFKKTPRVRPNKRKTVAVVGAKARQDHVDARLYAVLALTAATAAAAKIAVSDSVETK